MFYSSVMGISNAQTGRGVVRTASNVDVIARFGRDGSLNPLRSFGRMEELCNRRGNWRRYELRHVATAGLLPHARFGK